MANGQSFLDKFSEVSARIGNQVHLRSLRDGFATIMPVFILAGLAALFNNVLFTFLWSVNPASPGIFPNADILATAQYWGGHLPQRRHPGDGPVLGLRAVAGRALGLRDPAVRHGRLQPGHQQAL